MIWWIATIFGILLLSFIAIVVVYVWGESRARSKRIAEIQHYWKNQRFK